MNNEVSNIDDLFDDITGESLRILGFTFPKTTADFRRIELRLEKNPIPQPDKLKDPFQFLGSRKFVASSNVVSKDERIDYVQNFAQAAREGKNAISDEVKARMVEDKLKSKGRQKGH